MSDFYEMSAMMKELFPSNPEADKKALMSMAGKTAPVETPVVVQESVEVQQGSLQMDKEYSMSDFAKLAGVTLNETQKTGSAGQLKGKDKFTKSSKPGGNESPHPARNKLVGEDDDAFTKAIDNSFGQGSIAKKIGFSPTGELYKAIYRAIKAVMPEADESEIKKAANAASNSMQESIQERELTKPETKEKERIVKGMKKNKSDFKDRYGKDAEAVMYATATKNAKKNESIKDQLLKMLEEKKQK
tara:strand:+ start:120 stop:854 length:735 start_codon:yes stop_codon:yes gene_type:complete